MPAYQDSKGRWRYRFAHAARRYGGSTPKGGNTKKTAEKLERRHLEKLLAREYTGKMPTIAELSERFLEHQKPRTKPLTHVQQCATVKTHIVPHLGRKHIDAVTKSDIDQLVTLWSGSAVNKTINTRLGTLRRMLWLAVEWDFISRIPKIQFLKVPKDTPRFLTDAEAHALVEAAQPQWRSMIVVGLRTGLRIGELRGLQWADVDLTRRTVQVRRTDPGRKTMDATSPKGNRERTVPLSPDAIAAFRSVRPDKPKATDWIWPALLKRDKETRDRARSEKGCYHGIQFAVDKAGLTDVGWHTLRHTFASWLVMRGTPIRLVQKWLGHASIKETEKYSHLSPEFGAEAADLLDAPLATPDPSCQPATKAIPGSGPERNDFPRLPRGT